MERRRREGMSEAFKFMERREGEERGLAVKGMESRLVDLTTQH